MPDILTTCDVCEYTWDARTWTRCPRCMGTLRAYEPSQAEIRERCLTIQKTWSKAEQRKRCAVQAVPAEIHVATLVRYHEDD
jgi:hypothetical protein